MNQLASRGGRAGLSAAVVLVSSGLAGAQSAPAASAGVGVPEAPSVPVLRVKTTLRGEGVAGEESSPAATSWYGATPLRVGALSLTAIAALAATSSSSGDPGLCRGVMWLSVGAFLATGSLAHALPPGDETGRFLASVLLRAGPPIGGALLGCVAGLEHGTACGSLGPGAGGLAAGASGGALLDDLLVARRPVPASAPASLRLKPSLAVGREGAAPGRSRAW